MELVPMFKSSATRRAARFAARAQAVAAAHVAPAVDLTDPIARVEVVLIVQPTYLNGGPRLDMNPASALNGPDTAARGTWTLGTDGTERLTVAGPAADVAKWIAAYTR
jgi:hypothetical protein